MKAIYYYVALGVMVGLLSCQSESDPLNNNGVNVGFIPDDPTTIYVKEIINSANCDYDTEELMAELKNNAFIVCEEYVRIDEKWKDALPDERGIALEDDCCYTYRYDEWLGLDITYLVREKYEYTVLDSKNFLTFQFKSLRGASDDFLVAKIIEFKDDTVIIEGLLPINDGTGNVPNHRLYIGKLDPDRRAEWDKILETQEDGL